MTTAKCSCILYKICEVPINSSKLSMRNWKVSWKINLLDMKITESAKNSQKRSERISAEIVKVWAVQKHVNFVDLVVSFPTSISLQKSASIQPRTSLRNLACLLRAPDPPVPSLDRSKNHNCTSNQYISPYATLSLTDFHGLPKFWSN